MSKSVHLRRRKGVYYWRRRIPLHLAARLGRAELIRSLITSDSRVARVKARRLSVASDKLFAMIDESPTLTSTEIDALIRKYFDEALEADEVQRLSARPGQSTYALQQDEHESALDADLDVLYWLLDDALEAHDDNKMPQALAARLESLLTSEGHALEKESEGYRRLANGLLRAHIEALRLAIARRKGDYALQPSDPLFAPPAPPVASACASAPEYSDPPLSEVIPRYFEWLAEQKEGEGGVSKQNAGQRRPTLRLLQEFLGNMPLDAIRRADLVDFRDALRSLPRDHGRMPGWRDLTIQEKVAKAKGEGVPEGVKLLSDGRIKSQFSEINRLFVWAMDRRELATNSSPVKDFEWRKKKAARDQRPPFEAEELVTLFRQPIWKGCHHHHRNKAGPHIIKDSRYFLPLIALYSGMRRGEIAQLYLEDLKQSSEGLWYFDVNDLKDKRVKNGSSVRYVPVHPELVRLGFIDHYEEMQAQGEARLWPDIKPSGPDKSYGDAPGKRFRATRIAAGITREGICFHSFRHTFATALHNSDADEKTITAIMGHEYGSMSLNRYSSGLKDLSRLYDCVCKVRFEIGL